MDYDSVKKDIDGQGARITAFREEFIKTTTEQAGIMTALTKEVDEMTKSQTEIFQGLKSSNIAMAELRGALRVWALVAIVLSPVIGAAAAVAFSKVF